MFTLVEKEPVRIRFILAGNLQQARDWMSANRQNPNNWRYIYGAEDLCGYEECEYIRYGTWFERKDRNEIATMLLARKFKRISNFSIKGESQS